MWWSQRGWVTSTQWRRKTQAALPLLLHLKRQTTCQSVSRLGRGVLKEASKEVPGPELFPLWLVSLVVLSYRSGAFFLNSGYDEGNNYPGHLIDI